MKTFARLIDGRALDCQPAANDADLSARFHPDWLARNPFVVVPDGTISNAVDNGNGTFTNPVETPPPGPQPLIVSSTSFQDICETALGGGATGATRFGKIIRDLAASNDDLVYGIYQRFMKSVTFDKAKVAAMLAVLASKTIVTAQERTAILNTWPMV